MYHPHNIHDLLKVQKVYPWGFHSSKRKYYILVPFLLKEREYANVIFLFSPQISSQQCSVWPKLNIFLLFLTQNTISKHSLQNSLHTFIFRPFSSTRNVFIHFCSSVCTFAYFIPKVITIKFKAKWNGLWSSP